MIDPKTLLTFDKLYSDTYQDVLTYVICHCSNIEDAKDIVQNIYVEVLKKLEKNNPFIQNKSYLIGIAKNKINQYYRFSYKTKIISLFSKKDDFMLIDHIPSETDIEKDFIIHEDIEFIWNFLKKKKSIVPKIFYLYYYMGLSIKEISLQLNISESNVKNYLYRTLKELNELMKKGEKNVR